MVIAYRSVLNEEPIELDGEAPLFESSFSVNKTVKEIRQESYFILEDRISDMTKELATDFELTNNEKCWKYIHTNLLPDGNAPYCYLLMYIRLISVGIWFIVIPLLIYDVIANRIMHACDINWG